MHWEFIVGLVIAIPVILLPLAFAWYLNSSGIVTAIRQARARRATRGKHSGSSARSQVNKRKYQR